MVHQKIILAHDHARRPLVAHCPLTFDDAARFLDKKCYPFDNPGCVAKVHLKKTRRTETIKAVLKLPFSR